MGLTRRAALAGFGGAAAVAAAPWQGAASAPFQAPPLPFAEDALAPHLSARALAIHVEIHKAAAARLNTLLAGSDLADLPLDALVAEAAAAKQWPIYDYAAQVWNHTFFFEQFVGGAALPGPVLDEALNREFGGFDGLADAAVEAADGVFGGGWVWLTAEGDGLYLDGVADAASPLGTGRQILAGIDVWEHAYVLDYGSRRADYVRAVVMSLINWDAADQRFMDG